MTDYDDPYSALTRELFAELSHAGDLSRNYPLSALAGVDESAAGAKLQLALGLREATVAEMRFRAFGCPHLLAAAEWLCATYEGHNINDLVEFRAVSVMRALDIPVQKTGRMLLLEDCITVCKRHLS